MNKLNDSKNQLVSEDSANQELKKILQDMQQLLEKYQHLPKLSEKQIKDRQKKTDFANNLNAEEIRSNKKPLTIGKKGVGKSTFLYLTGEGTK